MSKVACQYAIVRFMPLIETGEFANVGIVMISPRARYFDFKLMSQKHGRVTSFFKELDAKALLLGSMRDLREDLDRIHRLLNSRGFDKRFKSNDEQFASSVFSELLRTREVLVRFSEPRVVLTENPKAELRRLYATYIERNFVTKEYQDDILEKRLRKLFVRENLIDRYASAAVGDDVYNVRFPFVEYRNDVPFKVIKPLNLAHGKPRQIIDRGGQWSFRVRELSKRNLILADRLLFTIERAPSEDSARDAYVEACELVRETGAQMLDHAEENKIIEFARDAS